MTNDDIKDPARKWEPLEHLPIFDAEAVIKNSSVDDKVEEAGNLTVEMIMRFAMGNLGKDIHEVYQEGRLLTTQVPLQSNSEVWLLFSTIYHLGMMDAVRLMLAQRETDSKRTIQ